MLRTLYLASVWLHIVAAMTWLGGLLMFVLAILPWVRTLDSARRADFQKAFGQRLSVVTWSALGVMAITGSFNLWIRGVSLHDFLRPEWRATSTGQLIIIKLSLVLAAAMGCLAHQIARDRTTSKWIGRLVLAVGLAIVAVAVRLVRHV